MRRIASVLVAQEQENMYLWENKNWPNFQWDEQKINELLVRVRHQQGRLLGMADTLGFDVKSPVVLDAMTSDIIKSSEIEGIALNADDVRYSVAWQLGIDRVGVPSSDRYIEGVVDVMFDTVHHYDEPLTQERLFKWYSALFPNPGRLAHITVGDWRQGDMQVVSGQYGKEKVHYEAPASKDVPQMMTELLQWINSKEIDPVLKAAILLAYTHSATAMGGWQEPLLICFWRKRMPHPIVSTACPRRLRWQGKNITTFWNRHRKGHSTLLRGSYGFSEGWRQPSVWL